MSPAHDEPVRYGKRGPGGTVTMDRPDHRNAQFGLHHPAHAHNAEAAPDALGGMDIRATTKAGA
ncbi:hypothetical protein ABZ434_12975 [Streptomyces sp. NPDC005761]|uniref:hypothetical protein n=1 Tax=Streptomyces sp. NPDC005761 TaxID=3157066 RepID=UPI0033E67D91